MRPPLDFWPHLDRATWKNLSDAVKMIIKRKQQQKKQKDGVRKGFLKNLLRITLLVKASSVARGALNCQSCVTTTSDST